MSHDSDNDGPNADQATLEEQLVAYLDGELDDESSQRVEQLLAADPKVRETLEKLEGTWELLDNLDRAQPDEIFTRSTLEMVAVAAADQLEKRQAEAPRRRRRRWLAGTASMLAAGAAGFLAIALFWPNPNEPLIRDLPVLDHLDEYRQIEDIEFLELLLKNKDALFGEEAGSES